MESQERTKVWLIVALCLLVLLGGYFFADWLIGRETFRGAAPVQPPVPLIAPVATPDIQKFDEVAEFTEGKPLPSMPEATVRLVPVAADEHLRGANNATVSIIEYAAITDTYARLSHAELIAFFERNADRAHWIFRHYPENENDLDYLAAQASECVALQLGNEAFWQYLDRVMSGKSVNDKRLYADGAKVGADVAQLQTCVTENQTKQQVIADKYLAQVESELFVSPSFIFRNNVNGKLRIVEGINTMEYMQDVLDQMEQLELPTLPSEEELTGAPAVNE